MNKLPAEQPYTQSNQELHATTETAKKVVADLLPAWWKFWKTVPVAWRYLRNSGVPRKAKWGYGLGLLGIAAYVVLPVDLIPEFFIPFFGYVDDLGSIPAAFAVTALFNRWCQEFLD